MWRFFSAPVAPVAANPIRRSPETGINQRGFPEVFSVSRKPRGNGWILVTAFWLGVITADAQNATWLPFPNLGSSDWNTAANWAPAAVPMAIATFGASNITSITFSKSASVGGLQFNAEAPGYTFNLIGVTWTLTGTGLVNDSSNNPNISVGALARLVFQASSTAGNATITTNNGGAVTLENSSTGGQARFITNFGGIFDVSGLTAAGATVGSIEGSGTYQLGSKALTVGLNNLSSEVSGTLVDGGQNGGTVGALIKAGTGTLTLSGLNTYTGGTSFNGGTLAINSDHNLGSGPLSFDGGTLEILAADGGITSKKTITLLATGGTFQTDAGTTSTLSGAISGEGSLISSTGSFRKSGPGTLILSGPNTYGGITAVQEGVLRAGSSTAFSPNAGMAVFSVLDLNGFHSSVAFLSGNGIVTNNGTAPSNLTLGSNIVGVPSTTFFGTLKDGNSPLALIVTAGGQIDLAGANTYSGGTHIVNGGVVAVQSDDNLGTGPLLFDSGTIVLGSPFSATTFAKPVTLHSGGGTLEVPLLSAATFSGSISGNGALTEFGVGTLILTEVNTYRGGTNVVLGTVAVSGDSNLGSGPLSFNSGTLEALTAGGGISSSKVVALNPGGGTFLADADTISTLRGPITGLGSFIKDGPGTLILAGFNTYRGPTQVLLGRVQAGAPSGFSPNSAFNVTSVLDLNGFNNTIGSLSGTGIVINGGARSAKLTVGVNNTDTIFSGTLTGGRGLLELTKAGQGTLTLAGLNTDGGATNVAAGTLKAASFTALSAHSAFIVTSGLELNGFNNTIGSLAGTGTVSNHGATLANLIVGADNTDTIFSGVLMDGGSGGLELTKRGAGTLTLTGFSNYSGGTNFNHGTLAANTDHNLGIGPLSFDGGTLEALASGGGITSNKAITLLTGGGTFRADLGSVSTLSGPISGGGSFTMDGPGKLTLTASNTYSGSTNVIGGTLAVNSDYNLGLGPLGFNGGTLEALATVGGIVSSKPIALAGGGGTFLADAGSASIWSGPISGLGSLIKAGPGTLILTGANTYSGGTTLDAGVLTVHGSHSLGFGNVAVNGGILNADPQPINVRGSYTQTAGGTLQLQVAGANPGQYDSLNVGANAKLGGTLQLISLGFQPKAGNLLTLVTTGGAVSGRFAEFADPFVNWAGPHSAVELLYQRNSVQLLFLNLDSAASVAGLTASDEISFSNANIQRLNLEGRLDDLRGGSSGFSSNMKLNGATVNSNGQSGTDGKSSKAVAEPILRPGPGNRWGVWITGFGDFVSVDGDANVNGYNFTTGGVSLGIDYRIIDQLAIGVMGEYSHTWTSLQPSGNIDVSSGRGGVYATWYNHGFYLNGAIYVGHNNYASSRTSLDGLASGSTEGTELSTFVSGGYDFHFGFLTVGPLAALQYTYANIDGFSENGSLAPLRIESNSANSLRSNVGFRLFYQWQVGKVLIEPSLKAAWEHEYLYSALLITAGFVGIPGSSATFFGPNEGHDSAIVSAGVSAQWTPAVTVYLNYDGQLGRENYNSNAVTGGVRISF
jgi:fibronectin-binding autotransporter adhesin